MEIVKTKTDCKHEYQFLAGDHEGKNFLFYCKYCLDLQLRAIKEEQGE